MHGQVIWQKLEPQWPLQNPESGEAQPWPLSETLLKTEGGKCLTSLFHVPPTSSTHTPPSALPPIQQTQQTQEPEAYSL